MDNIAAEEDGGLSVGSGEPFSETTNLLRYEIEWKTELPAGGSLRHA